MGFGNDFLNYRMSYIDELFSAPDDYYYRIESLIQMACINPEEKDELYLELKGQIDLERAEYLINYLYENQVCLIEGGFNYGQKEITNKINRQIKCTQQKEK